MTHRFINADAYAITDTNRLLTANMFAYCENNPVMLVDFKGEDARVTIATEEETFRSWLGKVTIRVSVKVRVDDDAPGDYELDMSRNIFTGTVTIEGGSNDKLSVSISLSEFLEKDYEAAISVSDNVSLVVTASGFGVSFDIPIGDVIINIQAAGRPYLFSAGGGAGLSGSSSNAVYSGSGGYYVGDCGLLGRGSFGGTCFCLI